MAFDRQRQARHRGHTRGVTGTREADFFGTDKPAFGFDAEDAAVLHAEPGDFTVLNDVDAEPVGAAGIAPSHRIMTHRAAAPLNQSALNREARIVIVEPGIHRSHRIAVKQFAIDAMQAHSVPAPRISIALGIGVIEIEHAALRDHGVVVEILFEALPQLHALFVKWDVAS